jgi:hypothetical protein
MKPHMCSAISVLDSSRVRVLLAVVTCVSVLLYVFQTSALATRGYVINDLEKQVHALTTEQKKIDVKIAQYSSFQYIESQLAKTDFVPVDAVTYIDTGTTVAFR